MVKTGDVLKIFPGSKIQKIIPADDGYSDRKIYREGDLVIDTVRGAKVRRVVTPVSNKQKSKPNDSRGKVA